MSEDEHFEKAVFKHFKNLFAVIVLSLSCIPGFAGNEDLPIAGTCITELGILDGITASLMKKYDISAGQVAVGHNGRVVYAKSFGFSDRAKTIPVNNENLFRIASVSKVITAVAIWQLVEEGKIKLQDRAFTILGDLKPLSGAVCDPRLQDITVQNLLEHTSGFSIDGGDPQVIYAKVAADKFGESRPASPAAIIRYRIGKSLDFAPGTKCVYSNFGFNVLGRLIEKSTGKSYEQYVKSRIFIPSQIDNMELARTQLKNARPSEVFYNDAPESADISWSVFDDEPMQVPVSYGADFVIEAMDAHGGWLSNATSLVKFASAVNGLGGTQSLLKPATYERMTAPTAFTASDGKNTFRACGVLVRPDKKMWLHAGALGYGTSSILYSLKNGVVVAAVFNHLPKDMGKYFGELDNALVDTVNNIELSEEKK